MIAVLVQPASFFPLLPPSELAVLHLVIGTAAGHHCQTTIGPQLSLGAKPVWGLQNAQKFRRPNRTNRRNLTQPFPNLVLLALGQQISTYFLAQGSQRIQLLVAQLRPPVHPGFQDLPEPLCPMPRAIDLLAAAGNGPAAIDGF